MTSSWFTVDKKGLSELVERRGKSWVLYELLSNCWDEPGVTTVSVELIPEDGRPAVNVIVKDDAPDGFTDLKDAWTLFAASKKKTDAEKRGRFNLGEKLVLALCSEATIVTTTGGVVFDHRGRTALRRKTDRGSEFHGIIKMTREELKQLKLDVRRLICPPTITTTIDGEPLKHREPLKTIRACLQTEIAGEEGVLTRSFRMTDACLYKPSALDRKGWIYELGIPVVETGDAFDVDVRQKVPLNMDRDNVTPSYLRDIRGAVLQYSVDLLDSEAKTSTWVTDAMTDACVTSETVDKILTARFGTKRVSYDPSDKEANDRAVSEGYTVIHGGSLPGEVWDKVKSAGLVKPAGQVTPTAKPFHDDGDPLKTLPEAEWPSEVRHGVNVYRWVGKKLLGFVPTVFIAVDQSWRFNAAYGERELTLNLNLLGLDHFGDREAIYRLALHEYAHHFAPNHLSDDFHKAICILGAKLASLFDQFGGGRTAMIDDGFEV